jgi:hypothetical protein
MNQHLVWPGVVLVGIGAACATIMALAHVDPSVIITVLTLLVVPVLAAMISAKQAETGATVQAVKEQTNGNTTALLQIIREQSNQLAAAAPAQLPVPPVEEQRA